MTSRGKQGRFVNLSAFVSEKNLSDKEWNNPEPEPQKSLWEPIFHSELFYFVSRIILIYAKKPK